MTICIENVATENLSISASALENLPDPISALDNFPGPTTAEENLRSPASGLENLPVHPTPSMELENLTILNSMQGNLHTRVSMQKNIFSPVSAVENHSAQASTQENHLAQASALEGFSTPDKILKNFPIPSSAQENHPGLKTFFKAPELEMLSDAIELERLSKSPELGKISKALEVKNHIKDPDLQKHPKALEMERLTKVAELETLSKSLQLGKLFKVSETEKLSKVPELENIPKSPKADKRPKSPELENIPKSPKLDKVSKSSELEKISNSYALTCNNPGACLTLCALTYTQAKIKKTMMRTKQRRQSVVIPPCFTNNPYDQGNQFDKDKQLMVINKLRKSICMTKLVIGTFELKENGQFDKFLAAIGTKQCTRNMIMRAAVKICIKQEPDNQWTIVQETIVKAKSRRFGNTKVRKTTLNKFRPRSPCKEMLEDWDTRILETTMEVEGGNRLIFMQEDKGNMSLSSTVCLVVNPSQPNTLVVTNLLGDIVTERVFTRVSKDSPEAILLPEPALTKADTVTPIGKYSSRGL